MASKNIFPADIAEFSSERHYQRHYTQSTIIYQTTLLFLIAAFISLFFIRVSVSVNSEGMLTAITERNTIKTPVSGRIEQVVVRENQQVKAGDLLFTLQAKELEQQSAYLSSRRDEIRKQTGDLRQLVALRQDADEAAVQKLHTPLYRRQYSLYRQQLREASLHLSNVQLRYDRQKSLFDDGVISTAEFDQSAYELSNARNKLQLVYDEQLSTWQGALHKLESELRELHAQQNEFASQQEFYTVKSPVDGTVYGLSGVRPGSFVSQGDPLGELSPDSGLIAEIQVHPRDIGLLHKGMPTRLQVDAFNYHTWGLAAGIVVDISNDVFISNGAPFFLVRCRLDTKKLRLPNGYEGTLKKGMGVRARFLITERTLFQLLYDKAGDWLDPAAGSAAGG